MEVNLLKKVRLEIAVNEDFVKPTVDAIIQGARHGVRIDGATLYTTHRPCSMCAKMAINAGVRRVVCREDYPDDLGKELLRAGGVRLEVFEQVGE